MRSAANDTNSKISFDSCRSESVRSVVYIRYMTSVCVTQRRSKRDYIGFRRWRAQVNVGVTKKSWGGGQRLSEGVPGSGWRAHVLNKSVCARARYRLTSRAPRRELIGTYYYYYYYHRRRRRRRRRTNGPPPTRRRITTIYYYYYYYYNPTSTADRALPI